MSVLKWSGSDLLHITLRFLGGVPERRMPLVMDAASGVASHTLPFSLSLSGLGAFPTVQKPRVIWVGLDRDAGYERLQTLYENLDSKLTERGFQPEERSFSPHITLARTRDTMSDLQRRGLGTALAEMVSRVQIAGDIPVRELTVMQSQIDRGGPRYTPLARCPLAHAANHKGGME